MNPFTTIRFILLLFLFTNSFSQNNDSLLNVFNSKEKHDTVRASAIMKLAQNFLYVKPDSARRIAQIAADFAKNKKLLLWETRAIKAIGVSYYAVGDSKSALSYLETTAKMLANTQYQSDLAYNYNIIGVFYNNLADWPKAIASFSMAMRISEDLKDFSGVATAYNNMGISYKGMSDYTKALASYINALKLYDKEEDLDAREKCLGNIGTIYQLLGNFKEALNFYNQSLVINEKTKNLRQRSSTLLNIGNNFLLERKFDESKKYFYEGLACAQKVQNNYIISAIYNSFGEIFTDQMQLDSALKYFKLSGDIIKKSGSKLDAAINMTTLAKVHYMKKEYNKAIDLDRRALKMFEEINAPNDASTVHFQLYRSLKAVNNHKEALHHFERYKQILDTLTKKENIAELTKRQMNYEFDKKTAADSLRNESERKIREFTYTQSLREQKLYSLAGIIGLVITITVSLVIYRSYRQKKKINSLLEEKNQTIPLQRNEVVAQKEIIEEKQKEIVDSINYAKRIQYTLLANPDLLKTNLNDHFIFFKPKDIVSGDFYWATQHNGKFYLAVCDSTGHGVPGAFMSLLNIGFLSEAVNEKNITEPHEVLNYVRNRLVNSISKEGQQDGFDGILVCFDSKTKAITYAAANNAPLLVSGGKFTELPADRMPVGKGEREHSFTLQTVPPISGATLYLYTDGYADQFGGPKGKKFLYKKLNDLLVSIGQEQIHTQSAILNQRFEEWKGNLEQVDDVLIAGIKI